jgi:uncharacterized protein YgiM (DUF1202 family)
VDAEVSYNSPLYYMADISWYNTYVLSALQKANLFLKHIQNRWQANKSQQVEFGEVRKISDMNFHSRRHFDELKIAFTTTAGLVRRSDVYLKHKLLVSGSCSTL